MAVEFSEPTFREFNIADNEKGKLIKADKSKLAGKTRVSVEMDEHDEVKIILKKDGNDSIKEIKFVCACGNTKSLVLDYSDQ